MRLVARRMNGWLKQYQKMWEPSTSPPWPWIHHALGIACAFAKAYSDLLVKATITGLG